MASVTVKMFATVRDAAGVPSIQIEASTLDELMAELETRLGPEFSQLLREEGFGQERIVILVNGHNLGPGHKKGLRLNDGDEVAIFPPVAGG